MSAAIVPLPPTVLNELCRQVAVAQICPACHHDPALVLRGLRVEVVSWHSPGCEFLRESRPALRVVPGGEPA